MEAPPAEHTHLSVLTADQLDQCPLLEGELLRTLGLVGVQSSGHSWGKASVTLALALALAGRQHGAVQVTFSLVTLVKECEKKQSGSHSALCWIFPPLSQWAECCRWGRPAQLSPPLVDRGTAHNSPARTRPDHTCYTPAQENKRPYAMHPPLKKNKKTFDFSN